MLTGETDIEIDEATAAMPFSLPAAVANEEWTQSGGNAAKSMGHVALGSSLGTAWSVSIGEGNNRSARLASAPVVGGGRVYTIDTVGTVRAFDARNGGQVWSSSFGADINRDSNYGGGVAFADGRVYATNGPAMSRRWTRPRRGGLDGQAGRAAARCPDGRRWRRLCHEPGQPDLFAQGRRRRPNWSSAAALEIAGVFGSGPPAVAAGTVVAGFSSGELNAYRYENGRQVWQDALSRTSMSTSVAALSDIDADPVIDGGQVFAIGKGGRMVALELNSGQRQWEQNIAGIATPWVAGEWVFVVTDEAKLIALHRNSGKVRWINQLPRWENEKGKKGRSSIRPGARRRPADRRLLARRADQRQPRQWQLPEPDQCRRRRQPAAGGRRLDALHPRRPRRLTAFR